MVPGPQSKASASIKRLRQIGFLCACKLGLGHTVAHRVCSGMTSEEKAACVP